MIVYEHLFKCLSLISDGRAYPAGGPFRQTPYISYSDLGGSVENDIDGAFVGEVPLTIQINVYASSEIEARTLISKAQAALVTYDEAYFEPETTPLTEWLDDMDIYVARQDFKYIP